MFPNYPDWAPLACLITGRASAIIKKAMLTRIIETVLMTAIGSFAALVIGYNVLLADFRNDQQKLAEHIIWANAKFQEVKNTENRIEDKQDKKLDNIMSLVSSLDRCLRERTCTK